MKIHISHSLGSSLLLHLGFGSLRLVPHARPLQLPHQRQDLPGGLIAPCPVDQRAVGLEDEVGVLGEGREGADLGPGSHCGADSGLWVPLWG